MKWYRVICAVALLALASCSSPSVPRFPPADEDDEIPQDSTRSGFLETVQIEISYWV